MKPVDFTKPLYWNGDEIIMREPDAGPLYSAWVFKDGRKNGFGLFKDGEPDHRYNVIYFSDHDNYGWTLYDPLPLSNEAPVEKQKTVDILDALQLAVEAARSAGWDVECAATKCEERTF
jgi:hypothetical protein